ncbi:hypothetical protein NA57DRAFT_53091 [Rhizodiscina lignyota]|uniref:Uncharacterized protein n=1 Tax=Rhizodiscina lignyota TaxID=1504668 RepID=A0A9P4IQN2_9PEZI|nr:hypothetical protein NA57DRAFT_53091 [Rhizodiscina lignyota]
MSNIRARQEELGNLRGVNTDTRRERISADGRRYTSIAPPSPGAPERTLPGNRTQAHHSGVRSTQSVRARPTNRPAPPTNRPARLPNAHDNLIASLLRPSDVLVDDPRRPRPSHQEEGVRLTYNSRPVIPGPRLNQYGVAHPNSIYHRRDLLYSHLPAYMRPETSGRTARGWRQQLEQRARAEEEEFRRQLRDREAELASRYRTRTGPVIVDLGSGSESEGEEEGQDCMGGDESLAAGEAVHPASVPLGGWLFTQDKLGPLLLADKKNNTQLISN